MKLDNSKRRASVIESVVNIAVGAGINAGLVFVLADLLGRGDWFGSVVAVLVFTPASVLRSYLLRRLFVWLGQR